MSRSVRWMAASLLAACLVPHRGYAQIEAGDKSVSVQGLLGKTTGDEEASFGMAVAALNVFQTRSFAWRVSLVEIFTKADGETATTTFLGGGLEWNFNAENRTTIPFIALDIRYLAATDEDGLVLVSPNAGLRVFVSRSTSFDVIGTYDKITDADIDGGFMSLRLGFSYYFGKDPRR